MNRPARLPAYTLFELTIAMLVSALLFSIAFTAFGIVKKTYLSFERGNTETETLYELDHLFKKDALEAAAIYRTEEGINMNGPQGSITRYAIRPDRIIRLKGRADTFYVSQARLSSFFEGLPVPPAGSDTTAALLDEFAIELTYRQATLPFHYQKTYSSSDLIHRQLPHDHAIN